MSSPFSLEGCVALITGGASGIGEATCRAFHRAGAHLIIADLDSERASALAQELKQCDVLSMDITDEDQVHAGIESVGKLDVLVNNAGIGMVGNIEETGLPDFQRLLRVNVEGLY